MRLQNLKEASELAPRWGLPATLLVAFLCLYGLAFRFYEPKPGSTIMAVTGASILLSLVFAFLAVLREVLSAPEGNVARATSEGLVKALNFAWATVSVAFLAYIGLEPSIALIEANQTSALVAFSASIILAVGYFISRPAANETEHSNSIHNQLAIYAAPHIQESLPQQPVFQATIADLTRLVVYQAGRAIGYAGSEVLFDDNFSLELDANARVARVYSNTSIIDTAEFMHWRLHMLLMGAAAEKVLLKQSSEVALDDYTQFDELAARYLALKHDRSFSLSPLTQHEAAMKAARVSLLRKNIFDRCLEACSDNREILLDLVKMMRKRSVLTYGDIQANLDRVKVPAGFPVARFDTGDILQTALLEQQDHAEASLEGAFTGATPITTKEVEPAPKRDKPVMQESASAANESFMQA